MCVKTQVNPVTHIKHPQKRTDAAEASLIHLLNTDQAAARLGIGRRTVQELAAERKLAFIKFGRNVRFHPADLEAFADANRVKSIGWKGGGK
jgi:excisionase family DNA binding protein